MSIDDFHLLRNEEPVASWVRRSGLELICHQLSERSAFRYFSPGGNDDEDDAVPPQGAQGPFNEAELSEGLINRVRSTAPQQRRLVPPAEGERRRSGLRAGRRLGD